MTGTLTTIASGDGSRIVEPRRMIVRDAAEWRALWAVHLGHLGIVASGGKGWNAH